MLGITYLRPSFSMFFNVCQLNLTIYSTYKIYTQSYNFRSSSDSKDRILSYQKNKDYFNSLKVWQLLVSLMPLEFMYLFERGKIGVFTNVKNSRVLWFKVC